MKKVTWSDIKRLFSDVHGEQVDDTEHQISLEKLTVRIEQAQFLLKGSLTINDRPLAEATIAISKAGIQITANVQEWAVADGLITVKEASLTLLVGKRSTADPIALRSDEESPAKKVKLETTPASNKRGWSGGLEVSGRVVLNHDAVKHGRKPINIAATFVAGKQNQSWFWVLCAHAESDISLSSLITGIGEGSDIDFTLKSVSLIASNANDPACSVTTNGYQIRNGTMIKVEEHQSL
jgi:hypothetical protein